MSRVSRLLLSLTLLGTAAPPARAQVVVGPPFPVYPPGGVGFHYHGHRLNVIGYLPFAPVYPPYAVVQNRIVIQPISPTVVVAPRNFGLPPPAYDLSGIDLDIEPPSKLFGNNPPPGVNDQPPAVAKLAPPPAKELPLPKEPAKRPAEPPADDIAQPRVVPAEEAERLVQLGLGAFRAQDYGVAARRFQQALDVDAAHGRAAFLLAQAQLAVGQFRTAVRAIEDGLTRRPHWPAVKFEPRKELYADSEDVWRAHVERLQNTVKAQPKDADFQFLLAYTLWFDGDRAESLALFRQARALTAEPRYIDLFLKHGPRPVAVK